MVQLANSTCVALGLAPGANANDLLLLPRDRHDFLDGLLSTDPGVQGANAALPSYANYQLKIVRQLGRVQEKFCAVHLDGFALPVLVGLLSNVPAPSLPTDLENLVFWAIISPNLPWHESWGTVLGMPLSQWRTEGAGMAVVAEPLTISNQASMAICALFGLAHVDIGQTVPVAPLVSSSTSVAIRGSLTEFRPIQARLLNEAAATDHPKWKCLALYRILENAYLNNIKRVLMAEFDKDARKAVKTAESKLSSEPNQLAALAEHADLTTEFEQFNVSFDLLLATQNQYATMLEREASDEQMYRANEPFRKGIIRFYKLRCSIAHAGTSSVIYEQFSDADAAASALLPDIERVALKSLAITV